MPKIITESEIEEAALDTLVGLGYLVVNGPVLAPDGLYPERASYADVVLEGRLRDAIERLNPHLPALAVDEAVKKVVRPDSQNLLENNHKFHRLLVDGVPVEYRKDGRMVPDTARLFDFVEPESKNNEFLAVNQFTIIENNNNRRPDIILFVNGLPLVVLELKNPADEKATTFNAFNQFQTYKALIPSLFHFNGMLVASDGFEAKAGTITSDWERFLPWKTIDGKEKASKTKPQLDILLKGMLNKRVFLDLLRYFIVFEQERDPKTNTIKLSKKVAAYHQYHAVNKALEATIKAAGKKGDKRCGVIWHTQGSGKSLIMVFYSGKMVVSKELENPTIVVLTDRNDLDDQLFGTFSRTNELLRQEPAQAENRTKLREYLKIASGGVVFTTIQKFLPEEKGDTHPLLSDRRNIIVIADEAHRSQYDFIDGFAKHIRDALPNAAFIGFTGTPIEKEDRNTMAVFGNYIDIYDIQQAVHDGATVKIYYESRLAELALKEEQKPKIDPEFEEVTEGEEISDREKLKHKWARLEAIVGSKGRIKQIAKDLVEHFDQRLKTLEGKGMVVCMSRRIAVELHDEIKRLRPDWHGKEDDKGFVKVIMTGSASDGPEWQEHIRNKERRRRIGDNFKNPSSPIKLVIVRDMWLTGFDVPSLHTMYIDKPMKGHGLMQAIARVNRVFKDKPGGLIVDYLGIADELKKALAQYTESGGKGAPTLDQDEAVVVMLREYEILCDMFGGFDYKRFFSANNANARMEIIAEAAEHILSDEKGKERYVTHFTMLAKAFALSVPRAEAMQIRDSVGFFQAVKAYLTKISPDGDGGDGRPPVDVDSAIKQIISKAIVSDKVVDIFKAAGIKSPDISILSEEFLQDIKDMPHRNLAVELLKKLLSEEITRLARKNLVKSQSFKDLLEESIRKYHAKAVDNARILEELLRIAREMRDAQNKGKELGLTEDEIAFYDALETNDSAVKILGDEILKQIARDLFKSVKANTTIDWTIKESVQAKIKVLVKRILKKYGYPPDKQKRAVETVLKQAKLTCLEVVEASNPGNDDFLADLTPDFELDEAERYANYLPVYSLSAMATAFGAEEAVENLGWKRVDSGHKLNKGMFVAKVVGKSMEPTIPDGSYCIFRLDNGGSRGLGGPVLVESRQVSDPETFQRFTVKRYKSEKQQFPDGTWQHKKITLSPDNKDFSPIVLENVQEDDFRVVAEFVAICK